MDHRDLSLEMEGSREGGRGRPRDDRERASDESKNELGLCLLRPPLAARGDGGRSRGRARAQAARARTAHAKKEETEKKQVRERRRREIWILQRRIYPIS